MATVQQVINDAVEFALGMAGDNSHGYSQVVRSLYNIENPTSFDCSSLTLTAYYYSFKKNGVSPTPKDVGASYTGNMINILACGFEVVATNQTAHSKMQKGDLELSAGHHVAMAVDGDKIVHARSSEGTKDTKDGSGNEIRVQNWYKYSKGWSHRLRFTGKGLNLSVGSSDTSSSSGTSSSSASTYKKEFYLKNDRVGTWQNSMNVGFDTDELEVDNKFGPASQTFSKNHMLWSGQKHNCPTAIKWLQKILRDTYGFKKLTVTGKWSNYLDTCIEVFQKNRDIEQDAKVGLETTYWLLSGVTK